MSELIDGFFDETNDPGFKLWVSEYEPAIADEKILGVAVLAKRSRNVNQLADRLFYLTSNHLYYKKRSSDKKIRGMMDLKFVRVSFVGEQLEENGDLIYKIKLTRNLKYTELYTRKKEVFLQWKELLSPLTIQTNFHSKFSVIKKIGKGAFASVCDFSLFQF